MTGLVSHSDLDTQGCDIVEALGGKWSPGRGGMCRCPAHAGSDPSLSVRPGDVALLLHCFAGCDSLDVLDALRRGGGSLQSLDATAAASRDHPRTPNLQPIVERLAAWCIPYITSPQWLDGVFDHLRLL